MALSPLSPAGALRCFLSLPGCQLSLTFLQSGTLRCPLLQRWLRASPPAPCAVPHLRRALLLAALAPCAFTRRTCAVCCHALSVALAPCIVARRACIVRCPYYQQLEL
eukprot:941112-Pleurochrysis_carterae.AAC.3